MEDLLTPQSVAEWLQVHPGTLARWRLTSRGPAWIEVEGQTRYKRSEVSRWLEEKTRNGAQNG